ncbi:MAG: RNA-guided pseudouridylation complex pseudouridine synthase subunit Cbf5 [Candidatus Micrarchaeota archaeon]|nr:RNA-guided pseudouridylation complex pseudouridine synthase subunit Cbf5 [Candidatus Micrarchaeota archaeon]
MQSRIVDAASGCFVVVDKPRGPPSAQVGSWVRDLLGAQKSGHIGTLDPAVSGVLIIALGKAIRLSKFLSGEDKEYVAVMRLHADVPLHKVRQAMQEFVGTITQKPPLRSAVAKRPRQRTIYEIELLESKGRDVLFRVKCQGGTYIRKLIFDMGRKIGCGANMLELRRIKSGDVGETEAHTLYALKDAVWECKERGDCTALNEMLIPPDRMLARLPEARIKDTVMPSIAYGAPIYRKGLASQPSQKRGGYVRVYSESGRFCGVAHVEDGPELYAKMDVNWLDPREFQKQWKQKKQ